MESIYKTFYGKYIDLERLLTVSSAHFIDRMGSGGWYVGFYMEFQLKEKPIHYEREFFNEECYAHNESCIVMSDNTTVNGNDTYKIEDESKILAVYNLQLQVDQLIKDWSIYKNSKLKE